jgi:hypothetical protein
MDYRKYDFLIGIDPGVKTGYAQYSLVSRHLVSIRTMKIHESIMNILFTCNDSKVLVRLEDARKRKWFGNAGREQLQGAGSIKRDCKILEDFLTDYNIDFELVAPKNNKTKINEDYFKKLTGWQGRTSNHARDAAMLVFGF